MPGTNGARGDARRRLLFDRCYIGVNAPELHHPTKGVEPLAREATEANRMLVEGQPVRLELDVQERDKYGRLLAS